MIRFSLVLLLLPLCVFAKKSPPLDSVVKVYVRSIEAVPSFADTGIFKGYFGNGFSAPKRIKFTHGSGVIVSRKGQIVTNRHVVENASTIEVQTNDLKIYSASVLATDPSLDLALIHAPKIPGAMPISLGNSNALNIGDSVFVIGSPFGVINSYSMGVLSGRHRKMGASIYEDHLQIDAAINPGTSGGGVFNKSSELVGIATGIMSNSGGFQGVGFAIPSDIVKAFLLNYDKHKLLVHTLYGLDFKLESKSIVVSSVQPGLYAHQLGFLPGDKFVSVNKRKFKSLAQLGIYLRLLTTVKKLKIRIIREGQTILIKSNPKNAALWSSPLNASSNSLP